jgi:microcystin degradation protein MlrC
MVTLSLGGKHNGDTTKPLTISGEVVAISEGGFTFEGPMTAGLRTTMGNTAVLRVGGIDVIISSARLQTLDCGIFRSQGIDPETKSVLGVKSTHQFRAAFEPFAREILLVDTGGFLSRNPEDLTYRNVRRPVWPLDKD